MLGDVSDQHIQRERERARELRQSRWWQTLAAAGRCYYCEAQVVKAEVTMDHIVPVGQGGTSTKGNVVVACKKCNTAKRDMTAAEWALHQLARESTGASS